MKLYELPEPTSSLGRAAAPEGRDDAADEPGSPLPASAVFIPLDELDEISLEDDPDDLYGLSLRASTCWQREDDAEAWRRREAF